MANNGLFIRIAGSVGKPLLDGLTALSSRLRGLAEASKQAGSQGMTKGVSRMASEVHASSQAAVQSLNQATVGMIEHLNQAGNAAVDFGGKAQQAGQSHSQLSIAVIALGKYGQEIFKVLTGTGKSVDAFRDRMSGSLKQLNENLRSTGEQTTQIANQIAAQVSKVGQKGMEEENIKSLKIYQEALAALKGEFKESDDAHQKTTARARELAQQVILTANTLTGTGAQGTEKWAKALDFASVRTALLKNNIIETAAGFLPLNQAGAKALGMWSQYSSEVKKVQADSEVFIRKFTALKGAMTKGSESAKLQAQALADLAKRLGTGNEMATEYISRMGAVKGALSSLGAAARSAGDKDLMEVVKGFNLAEGVMQTFRGNLKVMEGSFKLLNQEGLKPFGTMTLQQAQNLQMLGQEFVSSSQKIKEWNQQIIAMRSGATTASQERTIDLIQKLGEQYGKLPERVNEYRRAAVNATMEILTEQGRLTHSLQQIGDKGSSEFKKLKVSLEELRNPQTLVARSMQEFDSRMRHIIPATDKFVAKLQSMGASHSQVKVAVSALAKAMDSETKEGLRAYELMADKIAASLKKQMDSMNQQKAVLESQTGQAKKTGQSTEELKVHFENLRKEVTSSASQAKLLGEIFRALSKRASEFGKGADDATVVYKALSDVLASFKGRSADMNRVLKTMQDSLKKYVDDSVDQWRRMRQGIKSEQQSIQQDTKEHVDKLVQKGAESQLAGAGGGTKGGGEDKTDPSKRLLIYRQALADLQKQLGGTADAELKAEQTANALARAVMNTATTLVERGAPGAREWAESLTYNEVKAAQLTGELQILGGAFRPMNAQIVEQIGWNKEWGDMLGLLGGRVSLFQKKLRELETAFHQGKKGAAEHLSAFNQLAARYGIADVEVEKYSKALEKAIQAQFSMNASLARGSAVPQAQMKRLAEGVDLASASLRIMDGSLKVVNGQFQVTSKAGLTPFAGMTADMAQKLGLLSDAFSKTVTDTIRFKTALESMHKSGKISDQELEIIRQMGSLLGENAGMVNSYRNAVQAASSQIRESYAAQLAALVSLGHTGTDQYHKLKEAAKSPLSEQELLTAAIQGFGQKVEAVGGKTEYWKTKLYSMKSVSEEVRGAIEMLGDAAGLSGKGGEGFTSLSRVAARAAVEIHKNLGPLKVWRGEMVKSAEEAESGSQKHIRLTAAIRHLDGVIKNASSSGAIFAKANEMMGMSAEKFITKEQAKAKALQSVSKYGKPYVNILESMISSSDQAADTMDRLASKVSALARSLAEEELDLKTNLAANKALLSGTKLSIAARKQLETQIAQDRKRLKEISTETLRAAEAQKTMAGLTNTAERAAKADAAAKDEWTLAMERAQAKSRGHADALKQLGDIYGTGAAAAQRYMQIIGQVASNMRKAGEAIKAQIHDLTRERAAKAAAGKSTSVLDARIVSLNKQLRDTQSASTLSRSALQSYRRSVDNTYKATGKFHAQTGELTNDLSLLGGMFIYVNRRFRQFAAFTAAAAMLYGMINAVKAFIASISEFDQSLRSMQAIVVLSAEQVGVLGDAIRKTARDSVFGALELAKGMTVVGQAGFSMFESVAALEGIQTLATATGAEFKTVVELTTTAIRAFGLEAVETTRVADIFTNAINRAKLDIEKLKTAFNYVGAAGRQAGLSINEVTGTLMVLADNGLRASTMGTGLRRVFTQMLNPTAALRTAMGQFGVELEQLDPKVVGWTTALQNMAPLMWDFEKDSVDMGKAVEFFGTRAANAVAVLIHAVATGSTLEQAIEQTERMGSAADAAATQAQGLSNMFKILKQNIENMMLSVGDAGLTGSLKYAVATMNNLVKAGDDFIKEFPGSVWFTAASVAVFTLVELFRLLFIRITVITGALKTMWASFLGPAGLAALAVGAMIGYLQKYVMAQEKASAAASKAAEELSIYAASLEVYGRVLEGAFKNGQEAFERAVDQMLQDNKELAEALREELQLESLKSVESLEKLADARKNLQQHTLFEALNKDAEALHHLNQSIADPKWPLFSKIVEATKSDFLGMADAVGSLLSGSRGGKMINMLAEAGQVIDEKKQKQQEKLMENAKNRLIGFYNISDYKDRIDEFNDYMNTALASSGYFSPEEIEEIKNKVGKHIEEMTRKTTFQIKELQRQIGNLAPDILADLQGMTEIELVEFQKKFQSITSAAKKLQKDLATYTRVGQEESARLANEWAEKEIREYITNSQDYIKVIEDRYSHAKAAVERYYDDLRKIVDRFYDWEKAVLEGKDINDEVIEVRGQILGKWSDLLSDAYSAARRLQRDFIEEEEADAEALLRLKEEAAAHEMKIREGALDIERRRMESMLKIEEDAKNERIRMAVEESREKQRRFALSDKKLKEEQRRAAASLVDIEIESADKRKALLENWLGDLQAAYQEAIGKEKEYANAVQEAQNRILEIRKEAIVSIRENVESTNAAIQAINRAGMSERELSADKLREAEGKMREGYALLNRGSLESLQEAREMFSESRAIYTELGQAAAQGEAATIKVANAIDKVKEAGEGERRAIAERAQLREAQANKEMQLVAEQRQVWADWAAGLRGNVDMVMASLADLQDYEIGAKYFEIVSNAEAEIKAVEYLDGLTIDDKHYYIFGHRKTIYEGEQGKPPKPGQGRIYDDEQWDDFSGYASGGDVKARAPSQQGVDNVPAWLTAGEYVVNKTAVKSYGKTFLDAINRQRIALTDLPKFAKGGLAKAGKKVMTVVPKFARGGIVPKFKSTMRVVPKFAKGGIVPHFAAGGAVGPAEALFKEFTTIGRMLAAWVESAVDQSVGGVDASLILLGTLQDIYATTSEGFYELAGLVAELLHAPAQGVQMAEMSALVVDSGVIAENTALANQLAATGNGLLERIDERLKNLTTLTAKLGRGGDINIQHAVDARQLALQIQKMQRLGQIGSFG